MVRKQTPTETTAATETADTSEITSATVADTTPASKPKRRRAASAANTDKTEGKTTSKLPAAASKKVTRKKLCAKNPHPFKFWPPPPKSIH